MSGRSGYTLIEILLVLAVLAVLAGIALPALVQFSTEQAIRGASETVRSQLDLARMRAIETGKPYQFLYEPDGTHFLILPAERDIAPAATFGASLATNPIHTATSGEIADGLIFHAGPGLVARGHRLHLEDLAELPNAGILQQIQWSAPITYQPDGTADEVTFRIADQNQRFIELSVRGLTGMAKASYLRQETTPWD